MKEDKKNKYTSFLDSAAEDVMQNCQESKKYN
jgi:hypothetical protein